MKQEIGTHITEPALASASTVAPTMNGPTQSFHIQYKLSIGSVDDPMEKEADQMADSIMRMPAPQFVQRKCAHCEEEAKLQQKPQSSFIQTKRDVQTIASEAITSTIASTKGAGAPLPKTTKSFMESRFGNDFSDVKIHTSDYAVQMNKELGAQAFTVGNDIYFNAEKYTPESDSGKQLLAHELTHTLQQGGLSRKIQKQDLPDPTGTFTMRLNERGSIEFIVGTPSLPAVGSLGAGFRCENGRCQPIFGQNPFLDATRDSYTLQEARELLGRIGGATTASGTGSGPAGLWPRPPLGGGGLGSIQLPCPSGRPRNAIGLCDFMLPNIPNIPIIPTFPSPTFTSPFRRPSFSLGRLQSNTIDHFAQNNATLPANSDATLTPLATAINQLTGNPIVHIDGHTSSEGRPDTNLTLSENRANSVKNQLISLGVTDATRLRTFPKGESEPIITPERNEEDRARNRRVEVWYFDNSTTMSGLLKMPSSPFTSP